MMQVSIRQTAVVVMVEEMELFHCMMVVTLSSNRLTAASGGGKDMNFNKVIEYNFSQKTLRICGGLEIFPYQFALGLSARYLSCIHSWMFRVYIGPFKLWASYQGGYDGTE